MDLHCSMILDDFRDLQDTYRTIETIVRNTLESSIRENGIYINALESRIKAEKSLAGKLELKGHKYTDIYDLTDLVGARVITFYEDEVDKIAALVGRAFDVDWENSVDKRKMHDLNSFGYESLHYICRIPESLYKDPAHPEINRIRFEIQMRTALQHVWATINHDTGYKTGVEIPKEYLRNMNRLAGMLELADEQFSRIRTEINDYRRNVQNLVSSGKFEEVNLDVDSYRSYLDMGPFDGLNRRIAAINQAEIHQSSLLSYYSVLKDLGFKTLGDIEQLIKENCDDAYQFAVFELGNTDIDIISTTVGLQDLLIVKILKMGLGKAGLVDMLNALNGESAYNTARAERIMGNAAKLEFMNIKK